MKHTNYTVKQIPAEETHAVRHPVLRPGKPIETCVFDGDNLETTLHFGIFSNDDIIGVCSFLKKNNTKHSEVIQYQLRGMAVLNTHQGLGIGHKLLQASESILIKKGTQLIWCNAREVAVKFYNKNGYKTIGKPFNISDIGPHFVMYKRV
ncbi:GNAT family N-acetyltransferase [Algibacter miyuki]|uniref:GNAT family N-acetyltransferase n=1 Tax=Algibacter miyuki TaxID=1306933 RepID=A0ABV5H1B6_9FLAO|nr:GNAT family N-acetyltransferase [Algibacter miyuki]MDN3666304.1 GNAT family N-acetyltransferase [Algibacter miyuki]